MRVQSCFVTSLVPEPFGKRRRVMPLVFSFMPHSQEWCGVAK
jgi:hypothetical protein